MRKKKFLVKYLSTYSSDAKQIFVATNVLQFPEIRRELPDIPLENIIIEPAFKDTAAAIGFGSLVIEERFKEQTLNGQKVGVVVLASDHLIVKGAEFCDIIGMAMDEASSNSVIVTLGIKPNRPETGYGYIEVIGMSLISYLLSWAAYLKYC